MGRHWEVQMWAVLASICCHCSTEELNKSHVRAECFSFGLGVQSAGALLGHELRDPPHPALGGCPMWAIEL